MKAYASGKGRARGRTKRGESGGERAKWRRPREKIAIGASEVNASDLRGLRMAWQEKRLVLFLGAGVSAGQGIPAWRDLVLELLFTQSGESRRMGSILPHYRHALSRWLAEYFDYDLTILARVVKRDLETRQRRLGAAAGEGFVDSVRRHLYERHRQRSAGTVRTTLDAVVDLLARADRRGNVRAVVTFNFDDLLEQALSARRVAHHVVCSPRRNGAPGLPVVHPHGFLPMEGPVPEDPIVFTESEYHEMSGVAYHWAPTTILSHLRQSTVLFVGLSMSDPNLRRMLDASHVAGTIPPHWQVQKRHAVRDEEQWRAMNTIEGYANAYAREAGDAATQSPPELAEALDATLRQADSYDRELLESMGVKTILLEDYADIPGLLDAIWKTS